MIEILERNEDGLVLRLVSWKLIHMAHRRFDERGNKRVKPWETWSLEHRPTSHATKESAMRRVHEMIGQILMGEACK